MTRHVCFLATGAYPSLVPSPNTPYVGGAEMQQVAIMRLLTDMGMRVSLISRDFGQPQSTTVDGIVVHRLPSPAGRGIPGTRWLLPRLTDMHATLRKVGADTVYMRCAGAYLAPAVRYAQATQAKMIFAGASDLDFVPGRIHNLTRRDEWLFRWGLRRTQQCLVQNQAQRALLQASHGKVGTVVPNFLHEPAAGRGAPDGPVIWVGTITPVKQPLLLLALARSMPERRFVVVGGKGITPAAQQLHASLVAQAAELPNVQLLGFVPPDNVGQHFDGAAALVNTSQVEGFPNTFLQAWVRGVPTLAFVDPQVEPGASGNLVCRDVGHMASQLGALLANTARWGEASAHCAEHFAKHHSREAARARYAQVLGLEAAA